LKAIINGKIVTPAGVVENKVLLFDEKIRGIVPDAPADAEIIDANGAFVCPGLVDIHIHGYLREDTSDGKTEGLKTMAYGIAKNGVTSFLPTTMTVPMDEINASLDAARAVKEESKTWEGAEILGVHAEGPFINPSKKGAQSADSILKPDAKFLIDNQDIIRSVTLAPEMDEGHACIKEVSAKTNIMISMGHTDASYDEATSAIADGVRHATHLFNAMSALNHRNPGVVGAALASELCSVEMICDTFHINPALYTIVEKQKADKTVLITDCTRAGGMPDGEYSLGGQAIFVNGIKCLLADGTIAGSVLKLNHAIRNVLANTALPVHTVVNMASLNAAKAIHADATKGSLELGKDADIFLADEKWEVAKTIKGGKLIYEA